MKGESRYFFLACDERCKLEIKLNNHRGNAPVHTHLLNPEHPYRYNVHTLGLKHGWTYSIDVTPTDEAGNVGEAR